MRVQASQVSDSIAWTMWMFAAVLPENLSKYSRSKFCGLFSVGWEMLQEIVYRQKIWNIDRLKCVLIDCWTQLSQDTLNWVINQLPKILIKVIKAKSAHVEFVLDWFCVHCKSNDHLIVCTADRLSLLLLSLCVQIEKWVKSVLFWQINHNLMCSLRFMQLGKEYVNALTCKYYSFLDKILKILTYRTPFSH